MRLTPFFITQKDGDICVNVIAAEKMLMNVQRRAYLQKTLKARVFVSLFVDPAGQRMMTRNLSTTHSTRSDNMKRSSIKASIELKCKQAKQAISKDKFRRHYEMNAGGATADRTNNPSHIFTLKTAAEYCI